VQRALRLDPELPAMAYTFIQSVSGGILQGDRLAMEITIGRSAMAHVTTQSAIKVYRMERNHSSQRVSVRVEEGAYFELLPDYLIPYRGARLYQEVDLQVAADATMLFWDAVVPGRVSSGEAFAYELLHTRIEASDLDGRLRFTDNVVLEPGRQDPRRPGLLGDHPALGTFYVLTTLISGANLAEHFDQAIGGLEGVEASASQLPRGDGAVVRVVAADSLAVQAALYRAWREARQAILGVGIPRLHTIKYGDEPVSQRGGNR
jgi:urease accessory protein